MTRKELLLKAIENAGNSYEICKDGSPESADPKIHAAILETAHMAKGRRDAFEACLSAMNGNTHMLNYYATR